MDKVVLLSERKLLLEKIERLEHTNTRLERERDLFLREAQAANSLQTPLTDEEREDIRALLQYEDMTDRQRVTLKRILDAPVQRCGGCVHWEEDSDMTEHFRQKAGRCTDMSMGVRHDFYCADWKGGE